MPSTTVRVNSNVPREMVTAARERFPETREMSPSQLLRFALARLLGYRESEAVTITRDARKREVRELMNP